MRTRAGSWRSGSKVLSLCLCPRVLYVRCKHRSWEPGRCLVSVSSCFQVLVGYLHSIHEKFLASFFSSQPHLCQASPRLKRRLSVCMCVFKCVHRSDITHCKTEDPLVLRPSAYSIMCLISHPSFLRPLYSGPQT